LLEDDGVSVPDDAQVVGQAVKVVKPLKKLDISFNKIGMSRNVD
jgi:hypothetical protein